MQTIDLNSDLGEGFGAYALGDDTTMLSIVTSANVACGFHAGDPEIMTSTFRTAKERGVAIGAHPGFPDLWGFGRRRIPMSTGEIERVIAYQVGAAQALASYAGHHITFVKAHGALGNIACAQPEIAKAVVNAIKSVDRSLALIAIALSELGPAGEAAGLRVVHEIYADRAFGDDRQLVPRGRPGAVIEGEDEAAAHVLEMINAKAVISVGGKSFATPIDTVCVHSDTIHAVAIARKVRERLEGANFLLKPFS